MEFLRRNRTLTILTLVSGLSFVLLAATVAFGESLSFDSRVYDALVSLHRGPLTNIMLAVSTVLHPTILFIVTLGFFGILMYFHKKAFAYFFFLAMVFGLGSALLFKEIFAVVRPVSDLTNAIGWSFPSSHAAAVAIFFITLLYAIEEKISDRTIEVLFATVSTVLILLTGFSRIYLGVHWTTDVLAGFALGIFWASLSILSLRQYLETHDRTHS